MGNEVSRINLNGGDWSDWPATATNYRGTRKKWTLFIDRFLDDHAITDVILFGDCRPLHMAAHRMAELRQINVHVFEEGYIRPDWLTLERSGVNGYSSLPRDPQWYLDQATQLPELPVRPGITASFMRRASDTYRYYSRVFLFSPLYPFYRSHRHKSILGEGLLWCAKLIRRKSDAKTAERMLAKIGTVPYFLFPLQLTNDFQIREHSPFQSMDEALDYVLYSFARRAPQETWLVIKEHPLDATLRGWSARVRARAKHFGIEDRVVCLAGGDLLELSQKSMGMVTVNSTSATLALTSGIPTISLGKAIYNIAGLTHHSKLDDFWIRPEAPRPGMFEAFRKVLNDRCLVYGGLASVSATETLVESSIERLLRNSTNRWQTAPLKSPAHFF